MTITTLPLRRVCLLSEANPGSLVGVGTDIGIVTLSTFQPAIKRIALVQEHRGRMRFVDAPYADSDPTVLDYGSDLLLEQTSAPSNVAPTSDSGMELLILSGKFCVVVAMSGAPSELRVLDLDSGRLSFPQTGDGVPSFESWRLGVCAYRDVPTWLIEVSSRTALPRGDKNPAGFQTQG